MSRGRAAGDVVLVLDPADEGMHDPGTAANFNESAYAHVFDRDTGVGAWFRVGNRPNEGLAEVSVCVYLPDGTVAFSFARPPITGNEAFDAGGLRISVVEPFATVDVHYDGTALLLTDPTDLTDPRRARAENPTTGCTLDLRLTGLGPVWGGRQEHADGTPLEVDPATSFGSAHLEQHVAGAGRITVGDRVFPVQGFGLRDRSWGPRSWQAISWYRFLPVSFGPDLSLMALSQGSDGAAAGSRVGGMVLRDGVYVAIRECRVQTGWTDDGLPATLRADLVTEDGRSYLLTGEVLCTVPLRNRRTGPDGVERQTRILESQVRYRCGEHTAVGMAEHLDQVVAGRPAGPDTPAADRRAPTC